MLLPIVLDRVIMTSLGVHQFNGPNVPKFLKSQDVYFHPSAPTYLSYKAGLIQLWFANVGVNVTGRFIRNLERPIIFIYEQK